MGSRGLIGTVVAALALFASCDRDIPSEPSGPPATTAAGYEITLVSSAPSSGSTILAGECIFDTFDGRPSTRRICTTRPTLTFVARSDRAVADASLSVEFYTRTELRCAVAITSRVNLTPAVPTTITSDLTFLSLPPGLTQFCDLPATTTRVVAHLQDGSGTRLLTSEFAGVYTFVHPPNPPRVFPQGAAAGHR